MKSENHKICFRKALALKSATGMITITAKPKPDISENELPASWELTGGNGTNKLFRTIEKNREGKSIITCKCGNNQKETTIYIVEVQPHLLMFGGPSYHEIYKDGTNIPYLAPHWQDNNNNGDADDAGDIKYPVAFTRNSKMRVGAIFYYKEIPTFVTNVQIKGNGTGNIGFLPKICQVSNGTIGLSDVEAQNPFPNVINFYNPFEIKWSISFNNGQDWNEFGQTANLIYVTLGQPLISNNLYHTVVHLGCKNAVGESNASICIQKIWDDFADKQVQKVDGNKLYYYNDFRNVNISTASLLLNCDGQCGAWASFFVDILKAQGIDLGAGSSITVTPKIPYDGFIVKNWNFIGQGAGGMSEFPYVNLPEQQPMVDNNSYKWICIPQVVDVPGIGGQGVNINPASLFNLHYIIKIGALYYDPSYGITYNNEADFDNKAIEGYYIYGNNYNCTESDFDCDINSDGDKNDIVIRPAYLFTKNPTGNQIDFNP